MISIFIDKEFENNKEEGVYEGEREGERGREREGHSSPHTKRSKSQIIGGKDFLKITISIYYFLFLRILNKIAVLICAVTVCFRLTRLNFLIFCVFELILRQIFSLVLFCYFL